MSDNIFRLYPKPADASDDTINGYFEIAQQITREHAKALMADPSLGEVLDNALWKDGPVLPSSVPELFFHTNKRRGLEFDRVPVGHSLGYRCYDSGKHESADAAFQAGEYGDGLTEDQSYVDYLHALDDLEEKPRPGMVVHSSPFEPPEMISDKPIWREGDDD